MCKKCNAILHALWCIKELYSKRTSLIFAQTINEFSGIYLIYKLDCQFYLQIANQYGSVHRTSRLSLLHIINVLNYFNPLFEMKWDWYRKTPCSICTYASLVVIPPTGKKGTSVSNVDQHASTITWNNG